MRTIIHSIASATASSTAGPLLPSLAVARGIARPELNGTFKLLKFTQQIFWQLLLYAHYAIDYECFALTCMVRMRRAEPSSDFIVLIISLSLILTFNVNLLTFWVLIFQNMKLSMMRAHSCN